MDTVETEPQSNTVSAVEDCRPRSESVDFWITPGNAGSYAHQESLDVSDNAAEDSGSEGGNVDLQRRKRNRRGNTEETLKKHREILEERQEVEKCVAKFWSYIELCAGTTEFRSALEKRPRLWDSEEVVRAVGGQENEETVRIVRMARNRERAGEQLSTAEKMKVLFALQAASKL